jgi:hypothetical protein
MNKTLSRWMFAALGAVTLSTSALATTDVGVSVSVNQPGFYGRVDFGNQPPPAVIYAEPVIIGPRPAYPVRPIYMRVPPGHYKQWGRYCGRYQACNQPVYFVRDSAPVYYDDHHHHDRHDHGHGHGHGKGHGRGHH